MKDNTTYTDKSNTVAIGQLADHSQRLGCRRHKAYSPDNVQYGADQTTAPGSRAGLVQGALGHTTQGSSNSHGGNPNGSD